MSLARRLMALAAVALGGAILLGSLAALLGGPIWGMAAIGGLFIGWSALPGLLFSH